MISQEELPAVIEKSMPVLSNICEKQNCKNTHDIVRQLLTYTKTQVLRHNMNAAKKCLELATQLYNKGNVTVKNAIENIFIYSLSQFFYDEHRKQELMAIVPLSLYEVYKRQVINSHL